MKKADLIILSPVIFTGFQDETVSGMIAVVNGIIEYVGVDLYLKLTQDLRGKLTHPRGAMSK